MHLSREIILSLSKLNFASIRPTLIYGRGDPHNSYGPNSFYRFAKVDKDIVLFGNGEELRDHVHISDVSELAYMMLNDRLCENLNAVSGECHKFF